MEDTFQEMDINKPSVTVTVVKEEPKDKSMTISQVDGLVDSDYGDTDSSGDSSEDTPQVSSSKRRPPKRRLADAIPEDTYPEWGVINTPMATDTDQEHPDRTNPDGALIKNVSTIPMDCESEPDMMIDTDVPKTTATTPCGSPPKQPRYIPIFSSIGTPSVL